MLSDGAAFAASTYATHAGAFQPRMARRPTARWLAMRDACSPMHRTDIAPNSCALSSRRAPSARSRVAGTTRRARIAPTACGRSPRATGACWRSLRWRSTQSHADRELAACVQLTDLLFGRVIVAGSDTAAGFAALETTAAGDRVIGAVAYAPDQPRERGRFCIAVAKPIARSRWGARCSSTLLRHAKRVGVPQSRRRKCSGRTGPCRCWRCRWDSPSSRWRATARCVASCCLLK